MKRRELVGKFAALASGGMLLNTSSARGEGTDQDPCLLRVNLPNRTPQYMM